MFRFFFRCHRAAAEPTWHAFQPDYLNDSTLVKLWYTSTLDTNHVGKQHWTTIKFWHFGFQTGTGWGWDKPNLQLPAKEIFSCIFFAKTRDLKVMDTWREATCCKGQRSGCAHRTNLICWSRVDHHAEGKMDRWITPKPSQSFKIFSNLILSQLSLQGRLLAQNDCRPESTPRDHKPN